MRLIDADKIKDRVNECYRCCNPGSIVEACLALVLDIIDAEPTVALPSNDPLTLEDLREMDGDKIYVHYIDGFYTDEDGAYFGKFEQLVRECEGRLAACELPLEYLGKTWLAYRRKPEEGRYEH